MGGVEAIIGIANEIISAQHFLVGPNPAAKDGMIIVDASVDTGQEV
jgi:hypothetical protein